MTPERRFRVNLRRELDAADQAALDQAGIELARQAESGSYDSEVLLLHAADEDEARLRVRAALGGREELDIESDER